MQFSETEKRWLQDVGISPQLISYWKRKGKRPGKKYAAKVAKVLGKTVEWVLYGDGEDTAA